ncbi:MAG: NUDIX domain-containing protein [Oscillospiraceae bacterium]|jgi:8-oxo-dGTP pyrophosphatase MutT (NUDIX family)|nr:NUDIX domain-containing protein [Oscillospiraceae bacterium]
MDDINFARSDISFNGEKYNFSYRVAGILVRGGKVLLQKPNNAAEYAFPGGQVAFGETHADAIKREWREEVGADVVVTDLKWVEEAAPYTVPYKVDTGRKRQTPESGHKKREGV